MYHDFLHAGAPLIQPVPYFMLLPLSLKFPDTASQHEQDLRFVFTLVRTQFEQRG